MLRNNNVYKDILAGDVIPNKGISLDNSGKIPLVTIGDSAFPKHAWSIKVFNEETRDPEQRLFNKKLCSARVVTENAFGMLKSRFRLLYKKTECRLKNLKYIILSCAILHNLCIAVNDPCLPRWRLQVKQLRLVLCSQFEPRGSCSTEPLPFYLI